MTVRLVAGEVDTAQVNCALRNLQSQINEVARTAGTSTAPPVNITDLARQVAAFINVGSSPGGSIGSLTFGIPPVAIGTMLSEGTALSPARADHVHTKPAFSCRVTAATPLSVANNTVTVLTPDTEIFDPLGMHSPSTNPTRVTLPYTGVWLLGGDLVWAVNATGRRTLRISLNSIGGGFLTVSQMAVTDAAANTFQAASTIQSFTAGDYLELYGFQLSGGALDVQGTLWCSFLGPVS